MKGIELIVFSASTLSGTIYDIRKKGGDESKAERSILASA